MIQPYQNLYQLKICIIAALVFFLSQNTLAQTDSLILTNGDVIVGEFKKMERGVLEVKTSYSKSDFKIKWQEIEEIYSNTRFMITISDGSRYNSTISMTEDESVLLPGENGDEKHVPLNDIVLLHSLKDAFWDKLSLSIDFGYSFTKARNFKQITMRSAIGYRADRWSVATYYNTLNSTQDETDPVKRTDGGGSFRYYLQGDWYLPADLTFLSNTEQEIDLRSIAKLGLGKLILHTNGAYWGISLGTSFVNESFFDESENKKSLEGYFGTEANLFNVGDFGLTTKAVAYPGITENKRWRFDFTFDTKYDLPFDFYIKLGFTLNFDNQAVEGASASDYVFSTGIGWSL